MSENDSSPKRRLEKRSPVKIVLITFLLAAITAVLAFVFLPEQFQTGLDRNDKNTAPSASEQISPEDTAALPAADTESLITETDISPSAPQEPAPTPASQTLPDDEEALQDQAQISPQAGSDPETDTPPAPAETDKCSPYLGSVEQFFNTLDKRSYIKDFELNEKSSVYFPKLIQKLVDNPPVVTGETDDLYTILQNTAHFFRVIGKNNIMVLKGILDQEKDTFEQTLLDFYLLTNTPECLKNRFNLSLDKEPLYLYSGFFLNTMGGRLYLFRRDSMSRMVVNFYAITIVEKATREGRNKFGIDIRPAIDRLIGEIESSSINLKMRDFYLDNLYELKEKYQ